MRAQKEKIDVLYARTLPSVVNINENDSDSAFTWKVSVQQDLAPDVMAYVSVAKGYKGQAYDISSSFSQAKALVPTSSESSNAYEFGIKSRFLDNMVQLNIAAFLTDYKDFQAQSAVLDSTTGTLSLGLNNVGKLRTKGIEWEFTAKPADWFRLDFGGAYTDAKIRSFPLADCWTNQNVEQPAQCFDTDGAGPLGRKQNLAGVTLANAPKWKYNMVGTADFPISGAMDGFASLSYLFQSKVHYDLFNNPYAVQGGYGVFNASLGFKDSSGDGYKVAFFVNNLTKERFVTFIGDQAASFGNSRHVLTQFLPRGAQRYVGVKLDYNF